MTRLLAIALGLVLSIPAVSLAQSSAASQGSQPRTASGSPDFLFGRPRGNLGVRGSWLFARAGSDLFDFVEDQLTIERKDWNGPAFGMDVGIVLTPRVDIVGGFDLGQAGVQSEYRRFEDTAGLPITQETRLKQRHIFGSVRFNVLPAGQPVSRFAWVPRTVTPYVGAGAGALWYEFEQFGDFVDFVDLSVFTDRFSSSGFTPSMHVFGGADVNVYRALFVTVEGKYVWADATLDSDFIDFEPIDLAGFKLSTGIRLVF
jgi:hypothetical protein